MRQISIERILVL